LQGEQTLLPQKEPFTPRTAVAEDELKGISVNDRIIYALGTAAAVAPGRCPGTSGSGYAQNKLSVAIVSVPPAGKAPVWVIAAAARPYFFEIAIGLKD
jgi:hypothetical protein